MSSVEPPVERPLASQVSHLEQRPGKIVCVGRNYRDHAKELGNEVPKDPLLFLKPPSSIIRDGQTIILPPQSKQVDYEGEIGVVIGAYLRHATEAQAQAAIRGICAANDVTARDLQKIDGQWTRAKGFDTFTALGPEVPIPENITNLTILTRVNGVERQRGSADQMVFPITTLVVYITSIMTLEPGDIILTGTPAGVGPLSNGDVVEVEVSGISRVRNPVAVQAG